MKLPDFLEIARNSSDFPDFFRCGLRLISWFPYYGSVEFFRGGSFQKLLILWDVVMPSGGPVGVSMVVA